MRSVKYWTNIIPISRGMTDGKPTVTTRVAISADGKTLTATQNGQTAQGETVKNVIVADRQ